MTRARISFFCGLAIALAATGLVGNRAHADVLAEYDFETGSPTVPGKTALQSNDDDLFSVASNFGFGAGFGNGAPGVGSPPVATGTSGDNGPDVGNPSNSGPVPYVVSTFAANTLTEADAIAANDYFTFNITPTAGFVLNLSSLSFTANISNVNSAELFSVRSSVDSFGSNIGSGEITRVKGFGADDFQDFSFGLTAPSFQNLTGATEFRIYLYNASAPDTANNRYTRFDNVLLQGVTAVPEPGTITLMGLGLAGLAASRRRKRNAGENAEKEAEEAPVTA